MTTVAAPAQPTSPEVLVAPPGLAGVVVATTALSDVRGAEGFYHYRQYDAVELARSCSIEEVWHLLLRGHLPNVEELASFRATVADAQRLSAATSAQPALPLTQLRTDLSILGGTLALEP